MGKREKKKEKAKTSNKRALLNIGYFQGLLKIVKCNNLGQQVKNMHPDVDIDQ